MDKLLKLLKILIWCYAAVYLASCLTPYISPIHFRPFTFLALLFPLLLVGMLFTLILSIFILKKRTVILIIILLLGYKNIFSTTSFHKKKEFIQQKQQGTIRLLSWNVDDFVDCQKQHDSVNNPRRNILAFIKSVNADVMCFQDFKSFEENQYFYSSVKYIRDTLKYPYYYFSVDDDGTTQYFPVKYGAAIFSRFPIVDSGRIKYNWKHYPEHLMFATVKTNAGNIKLFNTHLRSMFLHRDGKVEYGNNDFIQDDTSIIYVSSKFDKLKYFDSIHIQQAKIVKEQLSNCKLPYIFCADLNSVPSSYVYQKLSSGLNDPFLQNGFGWGATYSAMSPTLRIDVSLMSKQLNAVQYYSPKLQNASDHYPVVTDIKIN